MSSCDDEGLLHLVMECVIINYKSYKNSLDHVRQF